MDTLANDAVRLLYGNPHPTPLEDKGTIWMYEHRLDLSRALAHKLLTTDEAAPSSSYSHALVYESSRATVEQVENCFGGRGNLNPLQSCFAGFFASLQKWYGDEGLMNNGRKVLLFIGPADKALPVLMWREPGKSNVQADLAGPNTLLAEGTIVLMQVRPQPN